MAKKRIVKKPAWNKGLEVGQKDAFTPAQVKRIRQLLADRGVQGLRDLALFSVAIDTMLQGPELLNLTLKDVAFANGTIAQPSRSRAHGESLRSDAPCPRRQHRHLENGLPCLTKNVRIIFSLAAAPGVLVR